jgi:hypothetical protein
LALSIDRAASLRRPQESKTAQPTTKAGAVAGVEQRPEFSQKEQAGLHPESDVKRRGRKSKYRKEFARIAKAMCRQGPTDYELAQEFEVATSTIWRWCSKYPEFCNAIKVEKASYDDRVERGLAQRALGYSYHAEKPFQYQGEVMKVQYVEHVPPASPRPRFGC